MYTVAEGQTKAGNLTWNVSLQILDKFIGLMVVCEVIRARNFFVKSFWENSWECLMFPRTMPRDRFLKVMRFLPFDLKTER